jgi:centrosomal protein CEP76
VSSDEIFFKSEIVKEVKRSEVKVVKIVYKCEMNLSYQMLKERYFAIEVWEYRRW